MFDGSANDDRSTLWNSSNPASSPVSGLNWLLSEMPTV